MIPQIGYKVVRRVSDGKFKSAIMNKTYRLNKVTKRNISQGPLALFKNINSARDFAAHIIYKGYKVSILEVEYEPSKIEGLWTLFKLISVSPLGMCFLPLGTLFADWIKPIQIIEEY